jgi:glycosyltransferase involved in cell wall biosynthesis
VTEPSLLLLIPAYNEERRIEPVLREFGQYFRDSYSGKFQLVVVLNGCRDNTLGVVQRVAVEFPSISALDFPDPIGKGGALIEGLKLACCDLTAAWMRMALRLHARSTNWPNSRTGPTV